MRASLLVRRLVAAPGFCAWLLFAHAGCEGPAAEVTLELVAADGADLAGLRALKLLVRDLGEEAPEVFGPFALDRSARPRLTALVRPGSDFYVDVWGCPSESACGPASLVARGCSGIENVPPGTRDARLVIALFEADDPRAAGCPPEPP